MMETCVRVGLCLLLGRGILSSSAVEVRGAVGDAVTLPCVQHLEEFEGAYGCWGRGKCDTFTCNKEMISTGKLSVVWRESHRYQILGDIPRGDRSLTIANVTKEDQGTYCCKMEIDGWFDEGITVKSEITLTVHEDGATNTSSSKTNASFNESQQMAEGSSVVGETSHSKGTIAVVVLIVLSLCVLGFLAAWKYYKIRNKDKISHMLLEDLQEETDVQEQNISI